MTPMEACWPPHKEEEKSEEQIIEENELLDSIGCWTCLLWMALPFVIIAVLAYIMA